MKTRIITAVVALIFFIPFVVYGGIPFELLSILLATIALYEVLVMTKQRIFSMNGIITLLLMWLVVVPDRYLDFFKYTAYYRNGSYFYFNGFITG